MHSLYTCIINNIGRMFLYHAYQGMHVLSFSANGMIVAWAKHSMHNLNLVFIHVELLLFHVVQHIDLCICIRYRCTSRVHRACTSRVLISPRKT